VVGGFGASLRAPGHVHHNGMEMVRFGAYAGLSAERVEAGAALWRSAGFEVAVFDDIARMVWEKLIMNVAFSSC
jgi:2-dehydropantoate 2-reductase